MKNRTLAIALPIVCSLVMGSLVASAQGIAPFPSIVSGTGVFSQGVTANGGNAGTPAVRLGVYGASLPGMWINVATPGNGNYAVYSDGTSTTALNTTAGTVALRIGNANAYSCTTARCSLATGVQYGSDSTDSSGTPGAATINKTAGISAIAAASQTVVITNSMVTATSNVQCTLQGADASCFAARCTPAAGSFTVLANTACTAATKLSWVVMN